MWLMHLHKLMQNSLIKFYRIFEIHVISLIDNNAKNITYAQLFQRNNEKLRLQNRQSPDLDASSENQGSCMPSSYAYCTRFLHMHACTHVRMYISRVSIALCIILCERRHVFPVCVKLCGVVSQKGGNIGEISAYTNSRRVDLHTYRWFDSPNSSLAPHTYTHVRLHIGTRAIS